ncbi:MAG: fumarate hydratase C-terminal domain-containing protein [Kiritimatiellae bacterium]|nr:fumarate hydratase C-terminal domain-containing protein [Kiritimatiellia bacterium]
MTDLRYPFSESAVRALRAGETVRVSGTVFTGRDRLHKYLAEGGASPVDLRDAALFHCGPVVVPEGTGWRVMAAGPTTSIREEPYMATIIAGQGVRVIIGKGGMGAKTQAACIERGCVYLQAVGGAAALLAKRIKRVEDVYLLDAFGATEAMWRLDVEGLEAVVGIDTVGGHVFESVKAASAARLAELTGRNG